MAWTWNRWMREAHFLTSLTLALLLVFFAATGFMAQHREWFHPRIERTDMGDAIAMTAPCDAAALATAVGADPDAATRHGEAWLVDVGDARHACLVGTSRRFVGTVAPWPEGVARDVDALRTWWQQTHGRHLEPRRELGAAFLRADTVWASTTLEADPARARVATFTLHIPLGMSLISLHRGRGDTELLVDVTAVLTVLVALTGVAHGLRYPGRRRRVLVGLLVGSGVLVGVLLAG